MANNTNDRTRAKLIGALGHTSVWVVYALATVAIAGIASIFGLANTTATVVGMVGGMVFFTIGSTIVDRVEKSLKAKGSTPQ